MKAILGKLRRKTALIIILLLAVAAISVFVIHPLIYVKPQADLQRTLGLYTGHHSDTLNIAGSTTVLPISLAMAPVFHGVTGVNVQVSAGGSGLGYANVIDRISPIGAVSRTPKSIEINSAAANGVNLTLHPIALDAICIIWNIPGMAQGDLKLTKEQVANIYSGVYTRWNQVDQSLPPVTIWVVGREPNSGTREDFEKLFGVSKTAVNQEVTNNQDMVFSITSTSYSIGYCSFAYIKGVNTAEIAGVNGTYYPPTRETIRDKDYPAWRELYYVTNGVPFKGSLIDMYINFVLSPTGQSIVELAGYVSIV
ncbi:MAG: PstS family phosphate ABC transporter substrate-binding protein [Candidatus Jordarchaeum sp.]|uniref:PstS family phosphate ABC transporter substrate-binding protein n=1 Tax=Candidatus Jordarchaeum sp. TaxID=2823881 RepID=UPI00404A1D82